MEPNPDNPRSLDLVEAPVTLACSNYSFLQCHELSVTFWASVSSIKERQLLHKTSVPPHLLHHSRLLLSPSLAPPFFHDLLSYNPT